MTNSEKALKISRELGSVTGRITLAQRQGDLDAMRAAVRDSDRLRAELAALAA